MSARQDTDMEVRAHADHHASLRLWLRLLSCTTRIEDTIRQRLREQFDITLPRFDLMAQLEREPQGLSMSELSRRMMVTGGNVTSIVDQLEKEQLVQRQMQASDRRSFTVSLTDAGRKRFCRHGPGPRRLGGRAALAAGENEQTQLHQLLGTLKSGTPSQGARLGVARGQDHMSNATCPASRTSCPATTSPWRATSPSIFCCPSKTVWPP
jgi:DNA-binding MarR family transcriptional regulator